MDESVDIYPLALCFPGRGRDPSLSSSSSFHHTVGLTTKGLMASSSTYFEGARVVVMQHHGREKEL